MNSIIKNGFSQREGLILESSIIAKDSINHDVIAFNYDILHL